jgi:hypothetical protein
MTLMASAQQKPKASGRTRNPYRRNGKVFGKNVAKQSKFSGNSIMGYKRSRVEAWAKASGQTVEEWKEAYRAKRATRLRKKKVKPILVP